MPTTKLPYWDRIVAFVKTVLKKEPAITVGSVAAVAGVVVTWVQTNHITTVREAVALGAPLLLSWAIRQLVISPATHAQTVRSLTLIKEAVAVSASETFGKGVPTFELSKVLADYTAGDPKIGPNAGLATVPTIVVIVAGVLVALFIWTVWIAPHVH